jgi:hypothetical protein
MRNLRGALAIVALGYLSSACAFTDIDLTLPQGGLDESIPGGNGRQVIVESPFSDQRSIRNRCGMQKNGYNMDTASAICHEDPNAWIAGLLADALRRSGFTVLDGDAPRRPGALRLGGDLLKIYVEPVIGFWSGSLEADVSVRLRASSQTGLDAERTFFVKGWRGGQMFSVTKAFNDSIDRATKVMLEEMVNAVIELMNQYPQLGSWKNGTLVLALQIEEDPQ